MADTSRSRGRGGMVKGGPTSQDAPDWKSWWDNLALLETLLGEGVAPETRAGLAPDSLTEAVCVSNARMERVMCQARERERRMQRLQQEREELLSMVVHDLRTPLVAIQGFVQLMEAGAHALPLGQKQAEYLQNIKQAAQGMSRLLDDLQTARRLEQGRFALRPRPVELRGFLQQQACLYRELARRKGVDLQVELPTSSSWAVFDPDRIARALGNLVENAVRFTPQGRRVEMGVTTGEGVLGFWVQDQGPGIEAELMPHLFERFTQGRRTDTQDKGSGLGLYICQRIAALHHGRTSAENLVTGGARLLVEIPWVPVKGEDIDDG